MKTLKHNLVNMYLDFKFRLETEKIEFNNKIDRLSSEFIEKHPNRDVLSWNVIYCIYLIITCKYATNMIIPRIFHTIGLCLTLYFAILLSVKLFIIVIYMLKVIQEIANAIL